MGTTTTTTAAPAVPTTTATTTTATTTTSETTTSTAVAFASPVIFGARQGAQFSPGEVTVFTCSTEAKSIRWMVGGLERGERSEEELRAGKLISSWAYTAKPGDSSVDCFAVDQEGKVESSASIAFVVKEEQVVTLRNIEDKRKVENNNNVRKTASAEDNLDKVEVEKEDAGAVDKLDVADVDAVDRLAGFAAAPEEQFFDAGEEKVEAVDSKIGNGGTIGNEVQEVVASAKNTLASQASSIASSSLLLLLLLVNLSLLL